MSRQTGWLIVVVAYEASLAGADESRSLRDDGFYQDGGCWGKPDRHEHDDGHHGPYGDLLG